MYMINRPIMERDIVESNPLPEHNWVSEFENFIIVLGIFFSILETYGTYSFKAYVLLI